MDAVGHYVPTNQTGEFLSFSPYIAPEVSVSQPGVSLPLKELAVFLNSFSKTLFSLRAFYVFMILIIFVINLLF